MYNKVKVMPQKEFELWLNSSVTDSLKNNAGK
jgi:hypothetical protein